MTLESGIRPIRSYVLRQGRMTEGQKKAIEALWPLYGLDVPTLPNHYRWSDIFHREAPCVLEIGFGMGESLVELARKYPEYNFIGAEVHLPGVGRCLHQIHDYELTNLKVFRDDVQKVLKNAIAPNSLAKVLLLFPDPWPKVRHHKRRIVQPDFVQTIANKLTHQGLFHLATDWQEYAEHMDTILKDCPSLRPYQAEEASPYCFDRVTTKYEKRGDRHGHAISDLLYIRL